MLEKILFVDDEIQILKAFKRLFMDTEYEIFTAQSGEEALKILDSEEVDIIVSDMKMPKMTGYELLSEVKKRFPNIVRIILSGYSDERIVFDALQKNIAKLYILKPWDNYLLIDTLEKVFQIENMLKNTSVLKLINNADEFPTIKSSYQRIINAIDSDKEIFEIVNAIECDYSIVSKLLHIVNSSYYGIKTGSIKRAVAYLGTENIRNIVIASAFIECLEFKSNYDEKVMILWKQSFVSNRIFNIIYSEFLNKKTPETAMTAGLLCNIGIAFMMHCYKEKYMEIFEEIEISNEDIIKLENRAFGTNHQEIGGYLLRWWDIPLPIIEAALYHHNPVDENILNKELLYVAHISEKYAWDVLGKTYFGDFNERVFDLLEIEKIKFEERICKALEISGFIDF